MDQQEPQISKEEFTEWHRSPVTQFIMNELIEQMNDAVLTVRSSVRAGEFHRASNKEGFIDGLQTVLNIDYEEVV